MRLRRAAGVGVDGLPLGGPGDVVVARAADRADVAGQVVLEDRHVARDAALGRRLPDDRRPTTGRTAAGPARRSSIITAIGWRAAIAGATSRPVSGAGTGAGVGRRSASGSASGPGSAWGPASVSAPRSAWDSGSASTPRWRTPRRPGADSRTPATAQRAARDDADAQRPHDRQARHGRDDRGSRQDPSFHSSSPLDCAPLPIPERGEPRRTHRGGYRRFAGRGSRGMPIARWTARRYAGRHPDGRTGRDPTADEEPSHGRPIRRHARTHHAEAAEPQAEGTAGQRRPHRRRAGGREARDGRRRDAGRTAAPDRAGPEDGPPAEGGHGPARGHRGHRGPRRRRRPARGPDRDQPGWRRERRGAVALGHAGRRPGRKADQVDVRIGGIGRVEAPDVAVSQGGDRAGACASASRSRWARWGWPSAARSG